MALKRIFPDQTYINHWYPVCNQCSKKVKVGQEAIVARTLADDVHFHKSCFLKFSTSVQMADRHEEMTMEIPPVRIEPGKLAPEVVQRSIDAVRELANV